MHVPIHAGLVLLVLLPIAQAADEWPQFRGPGGQGHAEVSSAPLEWSETRNVAWRTAIPGRGYSSPVVSGDEIWMTTAIESEVTSEERERRLRDNTGNQPLSLSGKTSLRAVCVSASSGKLLHDVELIAVDEPDPVHQLNSFASPTPVLERGRLYCHFGTNGTACLDTKTREVVWRNTALKIRHENGPGSSPVLWRDRLIIHFDGSDVQYIAALDTRTGKVAWRTDRSGKMRENPQHKKAYGTPLVLDVGGRPQLFSPAADWLYGYDPESGKELWKLGYGAYGFSIVPRPVAGHGLIYFATCYGSSELLAVRTGSPEIAWRYGSQVPKISSPILIDRTIYFVSDKGGILTALDALSGETRWRQRLGGNHCASPLLAAGRLYIASREGEIVVVRPDAAECEILARNELDDLILASPVAVGGALFIRTQSALYRIEKTAKRAAPASE